MITVLYSPVMQAYLILWNESVLAVQTSQSDVRDWFRSKDLNLPSTCPF